MQIEGRIIVSLYSLGDTVHMVRTRLFANNIEYYPPPPVALTLLVTVCLHLNRLTIAVTLVIVGIVGAYAVTVLRL